MDARDDYQALRQRMVDEQIAARGISDQRVLAAMRLVPRHRFVSPEHRRMAYSDGPLPIGEGQTISQPYIVALMSEQLKLQGDENVLEVGTGTGYQAAVLGRLARQVHTVERHAVLAAQARQVLEELGMENVRLHNGDGSMGLPDFAPFDAILVAAAAPKVPQPLLDQLADDGRLVLPVGSQFGQSLECWQKRDGRLEHETVLSVAFVPLRGEHGWGRSRWRR